MQRQEVDPSGQLGNFVFSEALERDPSSDSGVLGGEAVSDEIGLLSLRRQVGPS